MSKTKTIKQVSINQTDKIIKLQKKEDFQITYDFADGDVVIECKSRLTIPEQIAFCNTIISNIFDDEKYYPTMKELVIRQCILSYYTNVKLSDDSSELALNTDIADRVIDDDNFDDIQYFELISSIEEAIDFKKQQILHKSPISDLIENINGVISKLGGTFEGLDIKDVVNKLGDIGKLDESKLVNAVMKNKTDEATETNIEIIK